MAVLRACALFSVLVTSCTNALNSTTFDVAITSANDGFNAPVVVALKHAIDDVNFQSGDLAGALPNGYSIQLHEYVSNSRAEAQFQALEAHGVTTPVGPGYGSGNVAPGNGVHAILGHMNSGESATVSFATASYGTPMVSMSSTSDSLSDKSE
ncbi:MAG: hypothetical protein MHM6MM_007407, partial [Cercozoa sp. M6MM]